MTSSLADALDRGNLGTLADGARSMKLGSALMLCMAVWALGCVPAVGAAGKPASVDTIALPTKAKAQTILSAYARTGTGTCGPLTVVASGTIPGAGEIAVSPDGDIVTYATDAYTLVDVVYIPLYAEVVEDVELDVASNSATIPTAYQGKVLTLLKATTTAGTVTGRCYVDKPGAALSSLECALALNKNTIAFKNTDAVSKATVSFAVYPSVNAHDKLVADSALL